MDAQEDYTGLIGFVPADVFENRIETEWATLGPIMRYDENIDRSDLGWVTDADPNMYGDDPNSCSNWPMYDEGGAPRLRYQGFPDGDNEDLSKCRFSHGGVWADYKVDVQAVGVPVDVYCNYAVPDDTRVIRFTGMPPVLPIAEETFDGCTVDATLYGEINLPSTGDYNNYYNNAVGIKIGTVTFPPEATGVQRVRMSFNAPINFDWISFDW